MPALQARAADLELQLAKAQEVGAAPAGWAKDWRQLRGHGWQLGRVLRVQQETRSPCPLPPTDPVPCPPVPSPPLPPRSPQVRASLEEGIRGEVEGYRAQLEGVKAELAPWEAQMKEVQVRGTERVGVRIVGGSVVALPSCKAPACLRCWWGDKPPAVPPFHSVPAHHGLLIRTATSPAAGPHRRGGLGARPADQGARGRQAAVRWWRWLCCSSSMAVSCCSALSLDPLSHLSCPSSAAFAASLVDPAPASPPCRYADAQLSLKAAQETARNKAGQIKEMEASVEKHRWGLREGRVACTSRAAVAMAVD